MINYLEIILWIMYTLVLLKVIGVCIATYKEIKVIREKKHQPLVLRTVFSIIVLLIVNLLVTFLFLYGASQSGLFPNDINQVSPFAIAVLITLLNVVNYLAEKGSLIVYWELVIKMDKTTELNKIGKNKTEV